jgi:uncharacterized protein YdhG (YjbR/CyaY superfamily)
MEKTNFKTIDAYISTFPEEVQGILEKVRQTIQKAAPEAVEAMSYQIPTFQLSGNLVHFAAFKNHIGFYPGARAVEIFADELSAYEVSKGTIQFPKNQPIPFPLIQKIVKYRVKENLEKAGKKKK